MYYGGKPPFLLPLKGLNNIMTLAITILQLMTCLFLIIVVLLQSGKRSGLSGAIAGGADTFMTKAKAVTLDAKLAKMTKWVGLGFVVLTLALTLLKAAGY